MDLPESNLPNNNTRVPNYRDFFLQPQTPTFPLTSKGGGTAAPALIMNYIRQMYTAVNYIHISIYILIKIQMLVLMRIWICIFSCVHFVVHRDFLFLLWTTIIQI